MPPIDDRPVPCEGHEDLWHNGTDRKLRRRHPQFSSRSHREIVVTGTGGNLDEPGSTFLDCGSSPGTTHKRRVRILLPTLAPFLHTKCARSGRPSQPRAGSAERTSLTRLNPPPQIFERQQFAGPLLTLVIISHETRGSKTYSQPPQPVANSCACRDGMLDACPFTSIDSRGGARALLLQRRGDVFEGCGGYGGAFFEGLYSDHGARQSPERKAQRLLVVI